VHLDEPSWWYGEGGGESLPARLLAPAAQLYGAIAERRFRVAAPLRTELPVICIGNFTAGGTGKTPLTRALLDGLAGRGLRAAALSRGYGGALAGPVWVDPARHTAREVGDEPLLLAREARVMIGRDRRAALAAIVADGATEAVVMDDGLQNPHLAKDLTLAVVDARRGVGNGRVIPAGPLRADLGFQLRLVDGIVVMGARAAEAETPVLAMLRERFPGPVLCAGVEPAGDALDLADRDVIAFAGIAHPERFFTLLAAQTPRRIARRAFPDHHPFSEAEARALLEEADRLGADLVTTEKDHVRLMGTTGARADLARRAKTLPIRVVLDARDQLRLDALIDGALKGGRR